VGQVWNYVVIDKQNQSGGTCLSATLSTTDSTWITSGLTSKFVEKQSEKHIAVKDIDKKKKHNVST
jgi:hypothetical protein